MDFNFKFLGTFDIEKIKGKLHKLDWKAYTLRQDVHQVHKETFTVPLLFDPSLSKISLHKDFGIFMKDLEEIKDFLTLKIGSGYIQSAILIDLPAGKIVARHIDKAEAFKNYHRIHIPILTNEKCFFEVDGEVIHMKEGEIWEINNSEKAHSVENLGDSARIHLLIDWKVKSISN